MENNKKIVVGFSGGVDSMMTIKILQEQGYQPIAVFLKMFAGEKIEEVRHLADKLAVKLIVKDVSKIFSNCIIGDFLNEYKSNRTPNPCVKCNFEIKFKFLLEMADELRIDKIATGHYAQIKKEGKFFKLLKGKDEKKDQSYFLYRLTQKELARIIFPLGGRQKEDVKKEALKNGWVYEIKESQDVCFLNKKEKVQDFLKENLEENKTGKIEDEEGTVLGQHQGLVYYTQGQRKGLDLSSGPFYVTGKDSERNVLSVSKNKKHSALLNREILIEDVNWIGRLPVENKNYSFKSRYRAQLTTGVVIKEENNWRAVLSEPQWAVAKGQSLVVYDGEEVLGGGIIKEVL